MLRASSGSLLLESLTSFTNLVLAGGVPTGVRSSFFGATLYAFNKKGGGVRPIAVGLTLRRLVAKVACFKATESCVAMLAPRQLGVGVKGGAEALTHAARLFLSTMEQDNVLIKLVFVNAFNTVRRDSMLEAVAQYAPNILAFASSAYGSLSDLHFGDFTLQSAEGVQQGDPIGPLLFCLALSKPLSLLDSDFVSGYLDDIGLGCNIDKAIAELHTFEAGANAIGLRLNYSKCEVIGISSFSRSVWDAAGFAFHECDPENATLLGSPIHQAGVESAVNEKVNNLKVADPRLTKTVWSRSSLAFTFARNPEAAVSIANCSLFHNQGHREF